MGTIQSPDLLYEFEFLQKVLLKTYDVPSTMKKVFESLRKRAVTHFEQLTAPLMAKGLEDTALYRYPLLLSLNEVGGTPDRFGTTRQSFHEFMAERAEKWPYAMSGSSTHDSKRGEDVRARLNVLSEIPDQWEMLVSYWRDFNREKKILLKNALVPDDTEEYFLYQTLVGSWPLEEDTEPPYLERLEKYIIKALREAKIHSSWHSPDEAYEAAVMSFIRAILEQSERNNLFMRILFRFAVMWLFMEFSILYPRRL
jgi:(1->4)-alpha-D-glucan 1-alpha-D-glucosylmutase